MRIFVGVWPTTEVHDALAALPRPADDRLRWTPPEHWHVTLRFYGEVAEDALDAIVGAVDAVAARHAPVRAQLGPETHVLGGRVLMVPVAGLDHIAHGFSREPFTGHITVARARRRGGRIPHEFAGVPMDMSMRVDTIAVIRSHLGRGPARYETLASRVLRGANAP
jgi:2'-5' RNA ligase